MNIFDKLADLNPDENFILFEIGCHYGYDTAKFHTICQIAQIYAFEADPRSAEIFRKNPIADKVNFFELCVSDKDGEEELNLSSGLPPVFSQGDASQEVNDFCQTMEWTASSSIRKPTKHLGQQHPWLRFNETTKVKSITLDTFCQENNIEKIDFIWMDVQGAEDSVFRGAKNILKSTRYIYTEYSDVELYEGQQNLKNMSSQLENFDCIESFESGGGTDALFKNKDAI